MIILFLLIQIVISINTNQIIFLNDINEIRISGEGSIKQNDFKEYKNEEKLMIIENVTFNSNSNLRTMNDYAFRNCINLKEIQLPKSLEKIDFKKVFENCTEIKIEIEEENKYYGIEDDIVYSKNESRIIYYDNRKTESYYSMCNQITITEIK